MKPIISVIIPVYNAEKYLPKCLDSVVNQTYKNIEIIVINDCSSGNCEEIVKSYQKKDDRIIYLKHDVNKGLFIARETGVNKAISEYVLHVDSDDWIELDLCEKLQEQLTHTPDLIEFGFQIIDDSILEPNMPKADLSQYSQNELFTQFITLQNEPWYVWRFLFKKDIALKVYDELAFCDYLTINEDGLFLIPYIYYTKTSMIMNEIGYYYNWNNMNSAMREKRTIAVLQKELDAAATTLSYLDVFFDNHQLDRKLLFHIKYNFCKMLLDAINCHLYFYEEDKISLNEVLKKSIDLFGGDIFGLFISVRSEVLPNWIQTLLKAQDKFFPKDGIIFKVLKKMYYKIKRLKK